jgi:hypothetical protein
VPTGTYRFVVNGAIHAAGKPTPYALQSTPFTVTPWEGVPTGTPRLVDGDVVLAPGPVVYPRTYTPDPSFRFIKDDGGDKPGAASVFCRTCSFRPWARTGAIRSLSVSVSTDTTDVRDVTAVRQPDGSWRADTNLQPGEKAFVGIGSVVDEYGELNGKPSLAIDAAGRLSPATGRTTLPGTATGDLPRTGLAAGLPFVALAAVGLAVVVRRRRLPA